MSRLKEANEASRQTIRMAGDEDDVRVDPTTGEASTGDHGKPYHVECAPAQGEEE